MENPAIRKIGQNIKYDLLVLGHYGLQVKGVSFDTMIASYLLNPGKPSHGMDALALEYLNYKTITYAEVTGCGKKQICFADVDVQTATRYSGEDADITLRLKQNLLRCSGSRTSKGFFSIWRCRSWRSLLTWSASV